MTKTHTTLALSFTKKELQQFGLTEEEISHLKSNSRRETIPVVDFSLLQETLRQAA